MPASWRRKVVLYNFMARSRFWINREPSRGKGMDGSQSAVRMGPCLLIRLRLSLARANGPDARLARRPNGLAKIVGDRFIGHLPGVWGADGDNSSSAGERPSARVFRLGNNWFIISFSRMQCGLAPHHLAVIIAARIVARSRFVPGGRSLSAAAVNLPPIRRKPLTALNQRLAFVANDVLIPPATVFAALCQPV